MVPDAARPALINLLAQNFTVEEIDTIGKQIEPRFNSHLISGEPFGIVLKAEQAAKTLVNHYAPKGLLKSVIVTIIHLAAHDDTSILGRRVEVRDFPAFMQKLGMLGLKYDPATADLVQTTSDLDHETWGYLKEGDLHDFAFLAVDIAGNSKIQLKYGKEEIEFVYNNFLQMLQRTVTRFNGKLWSWAGDGGICAFYLNNHSQDAVECAFALQFNLHLFNLDRTRNRFREPIRIRAAVHEGGAIYKENKGSIFSDAINYVAHMEKGATDAVGISISQTVFDAIDGRLRGVFQPRGVFENIQVHSVSLAFPWSSFDEDIVGPG